MDVDWCLSCERKLDGLPSASGPYCSPKCLSYAQPNSSFSVRPLPLPASSAYPIRQWAQAIPPHIPAGAPTLPFADLPFSSPSPLPSERPPSPRTRHQPTPKLIERTAASTPLPTLCVSSPAHMRPTQPARASSHSYSQPATAANTPACMSEASTSLTSLLSEPMIATPDEDVSFGANIGALVRSWVGRDRANSTHSAIKEDYVIEKVTDYFPPFPQGKKICSSPSSSKKSKKTIPDSPAPLSRPKPPAKKLVPSGDRNRSTPLHSYTPTPVIFPSCRAAELDWVDGGEPVESEIVVAPRPQYHSTHYTCEPQPQPDTLQRSCAPSLSSSVSSSGSSVLLMAPKRRDGVRGRKDARIIVS